MNAILNVLSKSAMAMTDHSGTFLSKLINISSLPTFAAGLITAAVNGTATKIAEQSQPLGIPDYLAIVGIVSGIMIIIKNGVEVLFKVLDRIDEKKAKRNAKKLR